MNETETFPSWVAGMSGGSSALKEQSEGEHPLDRLRSGDAASPMSAAPRRHRGDIMSAEKRSAVMSRIRGRNTGPERVMDELLATTGAVFESHARDLPGRPDFVF